MVKLVVTLGFLVAFAAGFAVGMRNDLIVNGRDGLSLASHGSTTVPAAGERPTTRPGPGLLSTALNLTPAQKDQMRTIWAGGLHRGDVNDPRRQYRDERDQAVVALLTPEQKTQYDDLQKHFQDRLTALDAAVKDEFQKKVEQTKAILTPEQRAKYEEILSSHQPFDRGPHDGPRDRGDHGFRDLNRRGDDRATSRPQSEP